MGVGANSSDTGLIVDEYFDATTNNIYKHRMFIGSTGAAPYYLQLFSRENAEDEATLVLDTRWFVSTHEQTRTSADALASNYQKNIVRILAPITSRRSIPAQGALEITTGVAWTTAYNNGVMLFIDSGNGNLVAGSRAYAKSGKIACTPINPTTSVQYCPATAGDNLTFIFIPF